MYDYANILFSGKRCNLRCYDCIGNNPKLKELPHSLDVFPPKNIDQLIQAVNEHKIKDIAFTGTNTDPQLYEHEQSLINYIRQRLVFNANLSLHTNGLLALKKIDIFNSYNKASVSLPSFDQTTYKKVTGGNMPDIKMLIEKAKIPIKMSMLVTPFNYREIGDYMSQCLDLGITRIVIRKLKGKEKDFPIEDFSPFLGKKPQGFVFGWPVYKFNDTQVTICNFDKSTARGLFLFSDGRLEDKLI